MTEPQKNAYQPTVKPVDFNRLPVSLRAAGADRKYAEAVKMYATTDLSICRVAQLCGVTPGGLSAHIGRYHRPLLYARYGLDANNSEAQPLKVKPPKGQSLKTHLKYKDAIEACGDIAYIEYNVSQIARLFGLNPTALTSQLRVHFPEIIPGRECLRQQLGIADNTHRGARKASVEVYEEAMAMYRDTDMTIPEVAKLCDVSKGGLVQYLRFYHKDILDAKAARRKSATKTDGLVGELSGNGRLYGPNAETVKLYAAALELYRTTSMSISEIAAETGVSSSGFRAYLKYWSDDLPANSRRTKATAAKYADAIASLKASPRPVAEVAAEFKLNPDVFREYLKAHEPELAASQGMTRLAAGKMVRSSSRAKYQAAISEYAATAEPLKTIALRHGINYNSLLGYVLRNCPQERESHKKMVALASVAV